MAWNHCQAQYSPLLLCSILMLKVYLHTLLHRRMIPGQGLMYIRCMTLKADHDMRIYSLPTTWCTIVLTYDHISTSVSAKKYAHDHPPVWHLHLHFCVKVAMWICWSMTLPWCFCWSSSLRVSPQVWSPLRHSCLSLCVPVPTSELSGNMGRTSSPKFALTLIHSQICAISFTILI